MLGPSWQEVFRRSTTSARQVGRLFQDDKRRGRARHFLLQDIFAPCPPPKSYPGPKNKFAGRMPAPQDSARGTTPPQIVLAEEDWEKHAEAQGEEPESGSGGADGADTAQFVRSEARFEKEGAGIAALKK